MSGVNLDQHAVCDIILYPIVCDRFKTKIKVEAADIILSFVLSKYLYIQETNRTINACV